jgi:hypothetical protein
MRGLTPAFYQKSWKLANFFRPCDEKNDDAPKKSCGIIKIRLYGELPTNRSPERIRGQGPGEP